MKRGAVPRTIIREPRWPAALAYLAFAGLYVLLPERLTFGPTWITVAAVLALLASTAITHRVGREDWNRILGFVLLGVITGAVVWSLGNLIAGLPGKRESPIELLRAAVALWGGNVLVFAGWYWRLDAGGPHHRDLREKHTEGAFLFPQMMLPGAQELDPDDPDRLWKPGFVDYLFLAFNTSTAFSPTDVPVLSRWAKLLMMVQSCISLATIAILAARAINVL
jgi:hypothetical protein